MAAVDLRNQVAYVTGASRGIGLGVARRLRNAGATVVGIARPSDDLDRLGQAGHGTGQMIVEAADVSQPKEIASAFERAGSRVGKPDMVVMFAGVAEALGPIETVDPEDWWRAVEVDLRGTMLTMQEALKAMLPAGAGRIVAVYGNLGDRDGRHVSAFAAAKAGVARLTEIAAREADGSGVVVLGIHPGFVRTPMTESLAWGPEGATWLPVFGHDAEDRWGGHEAAADLVARIAQGEADQLAGRIIRVWDDLPSVVAETEADDNHRRLRLDLG